MKRNTFDETAPVVQGQGFQSMSPSLPCRACTKVVLTKFLMEQGGLCRSCFYVYQERGNLGLGIVRPGAQA